MAINCWEDKEIIVYPYNGILLSNNRKRTKPWNSMDESQMHYTERKEPGTKDYIVCDFFSTKS